jgi:hypothetical protein
MLSPTTHITQFVQFGNNIILVTPLPFSRRVWREATGVVSVGKKFHAVVVGVRSYPGGEHLTYQTTGQLCNLTSAAVHRAIQERPDASFRADDVLALLPSLR